VENSLFSEESFAKWSTDYVLMCHITTHIPGRKYEDLLSKVGGPGFPHFVFMDAEGELLATHNGEWATADFTNTAKAAGEGRMLKDKAAKGDPAAKLEWFCRQLDQGTLNLADAKSKSKEFTKATPAEKQRIDDALFSLEVNELLNNVRSEDQFKEAGKKAVEWLKAGKLPKSTSAFDNLINAALGYSDSTKNAEGFGLALAEVKKKYGDKDRFKPVIEQMEKRLEELKREAPPAGKDEKK
jgi:hypothetical protein